ncbi:hypothetical protein QYE76_033915 [Lolium multiflorum]|uniref:Reverse transcriptase domain-containing protein n=1 Tax=Lolium multiflorum TaxID=4521 RepID=A0AAD8QYA2_LOLMU|nr:hypothetical protein QYE76_033915 [Lolium multiflorum]
MDQSRKSSEREKIALQQAQEALVLKETTVAEAAQAVSREDYMLDLMPDASLDMAGSFLDATTKDQRVDTRSNLLVKLALEVNEVKCIKDGDDQLLVKDEAIKRRWREYFDNLYNGEAESSTIELDDSFDDTSMCFVRRIQESEVKEALRRMKGGKAMGPDGIPIEAWRGLGDVAIVWLTKLFNLIFRSNKMPEEWRRSILVPIFKNKGDVQSCTNYRGIKLMSHTMKLWERVIEHRLRRLTSVTKNQFGFMPGRSTMEAIFLVRQLMERYMEQKKDLHMVFIDLEKAYDKIPRNVMWWALEKHKVPIKYITLIKDMYDNVVTSVRTSDGDTDDFPIRIGLHQGSALSPYLFDLVMDEVTRDIQGDIPWYRTRRIARFQDRAGQVREYLEFCTNTLAMVYNAMFPRNPQPKTLPDLMDKFISAHQVHGFVKAQLMAGARFAMIMLQICHPKLDMTNVVEVCHAKLRKRRKNVDKINDVVTPVAEEMIDDLIRMDADFFMEGHYADFMGASAKGERINIDDLMKID